ncbi:MAG: NUDIX hydrolase [Candidatus Heimdallarchaeota archaeon]|nr:NUDIX hydrolase [Candidatus Heimdallarchaeota archaeon]
MDDWHLTQKSTPKQGSLVHTEIELDLKKFELLKEIHHYAGKDHEYQIVKANNWVLIIPVENNNFKMIWQYRAAWRRPSLEFPAGKLNLGEEFITAALRELKEETGLIGGKMIEIGEFNPVSWTTQRVKLFVASDFSQAETQFDESEDIQLVSIPIRKFWDKVVCGDIVDMPTVAAYSAYIQSIRPEFHNYV